MADEKTDQSDKVNALKLHGTLNPHPEGVSDAQFADHIFFDKRDLLQVKYEMLRLVKKDGATVTDAAHAFGFSRLSYYRLQDAFEKGGIIALLPERRGPKDAHKLTAEIMTFIADEVAKDEQLKARALCQLVAQRFSVTIHPRSIERALTRRKKNENRL